jgi:starch synthase
MPVNLKVLLAAAEVQPLIKTGGLADVCNALPKALRRLDVDARLLLPAYRGVAEQTDARPLGRSFRPILAGDKVRLLKGHLPDSRVPLYLIDCPTLYDRPGGPYGDHYGRDFWDNALRFGVLSKVAALFGSTNGPDAWRPDVVHGHDWHAGLASAYLKFDRSSTAAAVFTVHNLAYQGNFDRKVRKALGISSLAFHMEGLEFYGHLSFMKAGLYYSDEVTTVSPTYAREIQTPEYGCAMEGVLRHRADHLTGILNGIDTDDWNPASDTLIESRYDRGNRAGKAANKASLQARGPLAPDAGAPLLGMLGRMSPQKGWSILIEAVPALLDAGAQLFIVGGGSGEFEIRLEALQRRHPGQLAFHKGFSEKLAHRLMAGADALLVPSRFEPCGLVQMYAQRYGTIPIAHRTGGLVDTIGDADLAPPGRRTGFLYDRPTPLALAVAVRRALKVYREDRARWEALQDAGMATDFGWHAAAMRYVETYQNALDARREERVFG